MKNEEHTRGMSTMNLKKFNIRNKKKPFPSATNKERNHVSERHRKQKKSLQLKKL